jgi:hypothetical protein
VRVVLEDNLSWWLKYPTDEKENKKYILEAHHTKKQNVTISNCLLRIEDKLNVHTVGLLNENAKISKTTINALKIRLNKFLWIGF